jgi:tetratricopeptide (TPR) repeat protein
LSKALFGQEKLKEALEHIRIACKINSLTLPPEHPRTIDGQQWLDELEGQLAYSEKEYARAEGFLRRRVEAEAKVLPTDHEDLILHRFTLARALYYQEKLDEALEHMKIAYTSRSSTLPADHHSVIQYRKWLEGIEEAVQEYAENTDVEKISS